MTDDERIEESAEEDTEQSETAAKETQEGHEEPDAQSEFETEAPPPDTDVFDMLRAAIGLFTQEAWIALGLQPRYGAGETEMDLRCAKVAIDTTQLLVEQLGDEAAEDEKRDFDRTLTDLRVNFMRRRKRAEEQAPEA